MSSTLDSFGMFMGAPFSMNRNDQLPNDRLNTTYVLLYILSLCSALLRKGFSIIIISVKKYKIDSKAEIGLIASNYSLGYGLSKIISGILADIFSPDLLLGYGMIFASFIIMFVPYIQNNTLIRVMYLFGGFFIGVVTPTLNKITVSLPNVKKDELGVVWSLVTAFSNVGFMIAPFVVIPICSYSVQLGSAIVGGCCVIITILVMVFTRSNTKNSSTNELSHSNEIQQESKLLNKVLEKLDRNSDSHVLRRNKIGNIFASIWDIPFSALFTWELMIIYASNLITTFVMKGIADWTESTEIVLWSEIGGIAGTISSGAASTWLRGNNMLTSLLFSVIGIFPLYLIIYISQDLSLFNEQGLSEGRANAHLTAQSLFVLRIFFFACGFSINGPKTLLPLSALQRVPKNISGSVNGISGMIGQIGAVTAGYLLGKAVDFIGWSSFLYLMLSSMILLTMLLAISCCIFPYNYHMECKIHTEEDPVLSKKNE